MAIRGTEKTPRIVTPVPGPESKKVVRKDDRYLATSTKTAPLTIARGRGVVVEDLDGNRFLDFASGIGVLNTGHCHPKVVKAVQDQAAKFLHYAGTDFYYPQQAELAARISKIVPIAGASKTFFTNSGAEANEASIKFAKAATGRQRFLAFQGGFHGRTQGALALTASKAVQQRGFFPSMPGVAHAPFPAPFRNMWGIDGYEEPDELSNRALDAIEGMFDTMLPPEDVAGVFFEPVQGEGGYHVPPVPFVKGLRKLCDAHGILLISDEVQAGYGRTGKWFGIEHFGVKADIVSIAKAMGSGMPIGASVVRAELDFDHKGRHSNTYGGNPVACAAGLATIDVIESEGLVKNAAKMGELLGKRLDDMQQAYGGIGDARGLGLMRAVDFTKAGKPDAATRDKVEEAAWKRGLVTLGCGASGIRFIPSLNVTEGQIHGAMDVFEEALKACKA